MSWPDIEHQSTKHLMNEKEMENNKDEEDLDNLTKNTSENSSDEIIPLNDKDIINSIQDSENMEVHHHSHHEHGKRNWKNYFWEFLMLFLAVFCGFLAEYQLEHKIEHDREKVYINNMYDDLQEDVIHFMEYDKKTSEFLSAIDSMMLLMKSNDRNLHMNRIYYLARNATMNVQNFISTNSRTFEQMKESGYLRLIRNQLVADSVSSYYFSMQRIEIQNRILQDRIADYMQTVGKVFDAQVLFQIFKNKTEPVSDSLKLITTDPQEINSFLTSAQYNYGARTLQKDLCNERAKCAQQLLEIIKKEYHLEDE